MENQFVKSGLARATFATALLVATGLIPTQACAQTPAAAPAMETAYQVLLSNPKVIKTLEAIKADDDTALAEQKRITEISRWERASRAHGGNYNHNHPLKYEPTPR